MSVERQPKATEPGAGPREEPVTRAQAPGQNKDNHSEETREFETKEASRSKETNEFQTKSKTLKKTEFQTKEQNAQKKQNLRTRSKPLKGD